MEPGQHRAGVTFGGPFTTTLGPPIPIPNLIVEGRSGLEPVAGRPLDVNYGLNATGIPVFPSTALLLHGRVRSAPPPGAVWPGAQTEPEQGM